MMCRRAGERRRRLGCGAYPVVRQPGSRHRRTVGIAAVVAMIHLGMPDTEQNSERTDPL